MCAYYMHKKIISWRTEKNKGKFWDLKAKKRRRVSPAAVAYTILLSLTWAS